MKIYSIISANSETIDQTSNPVCPDGHIEMRERRPSPVHVAVDDGTWQLLPQSINEIRSQLSVAVQIMLDTKAQERHYDDIKSACTYVTSTNPQFAAEAQACVAWRDAVWATCYELLDKVTTGKIPVLTEAELLIVLPKLQWPEVAGVVVEEGVNVQVE